MASIANPKQRKNRIGLDIYIIQTELAYIS